MKVGLLCVLLAGSLACFRTSIAPGGQTTGSPIERCNPPCGAHASCNLDGTCVCDPNYDECPLDDGGAACVDQLTDGPNCGGCGIACPDDETCIGGNCTCHQTTCSNDGGSVCTELDEDPLNCGICGYVCPTGENCVLGECSCEPSLTILRCATDGGLACVDLTTDNDGGCGSFGCLCFEDGGRCCPGSGECADLSTDPYNCGACGNVCASGSCILGDAGTGVCNCPMPFAWCPQDDGGLACVDRYSDFNHCGSCTACAPPATRCVLGNCM